MADAINDTAKESVVETELPASPVNTEVVNTETVETPAIIPTKPVESANPSFDAQKSYETLEKRWKDTQASFTRVSQDRSELRKAHQELQKKFETLMEQFQHATEAPIDMEQFKRDFEKNGPKAFDSYLNKQLEAREKKIHEQYASKFETLTKQNDEISLAWGVARRNANVEKYPNFADLYPKMVEISAEPNCPVDASEGIDQFLDKLYELAKSRSSEEAVQIRAAQAKKQAEADAAKESRGTVAGTGKKGVVKEPDLQKMSEGDLEKYIAEQHGTLE